MGKIVTLLAIVFLAPALVIGCSVPEMEKEENTVHTETEISSTGTETPEIIETATFALG